MKAASLSKPSVTVCRQKLRYQYYKTREKAKKSRFSRYVILARRRISDKGYPSRTCVDIRGLRLQEALVALNKDTKGFGFAEDPPQVGRDKISLRSRLLICHEVDPKVLYHSLSGLERLYAAADKVEPRDEELLFELSAGIQYVHEDFAATSSSLARLLPERKIDFSLLWTIFPPNSTAVGYDRLGLKQAYRVKSTTTKERKDHTEYFELSVDNLNSDGLQIGWVRNIQLIIDEFEGVMDIMDLPYWPLEMHTSAAHVKSELIAAGRAAHSKHGRQLVGYHGHALKEVLDKKGEKQLVKFNVSPCYRASDLSVSADLACSHTVGCFLILKHLHEHSQTIVWCRTSSPLSRCHWKMMRLCSCLPLCMAVVSVTRTGVSIAFATSRAQH